MYRCSNIYGGHLVYEEKPKITVPALGMVVGWAVFDEKRQLVTGSSYMRGGNNGVLLELNTFVPQQTISVDPDAQFHHEKGLYFWLGQMHTHYGHFLLSSLQRLWALDEYERHDITLVIPSNDLDKCFSLQHIKESFEALGIRREQVISASEYDVFPDLKVPEPAFVENASVSSCWGDFMRKLGESLSPPLQRPLDDTPVYFSKERLASGVRRIEGESDLSKILASRGVRVVYPEELSLPEQIKIWREHKTFGSFSGSSLHTGAFVREKNIVSVHGNSNALTNQTMIDEVQGHKSIYLNAEDQRAYVGKEAMFDSVDRLLDPERVAAGILSAFDHLHVRNGVIRPRARGESIAGTIFVNEPMGRNLARGRPSFVSSVDEVWCHACGSPAAEGAGAVSGRRSRGYQFHTKAESDPWWQVDLGAPCLLTEVRVFNRCDSQQERARYLVFLASDNGEVWTEIHRKVSAEDFGQEALPNPYRWTIYRPTIVRHLRLVQPGFNYFHLDQVEVFGELVEAMGDQAF